MQLAATSLLSRSLFPFLQTCLPVQNRGRCNYFATQCCRRWVLWSQLLHVDNLLPFGLACKAFKDLADEALRQRYRVRRGSRANLAVIGHVNSGKTTTVVNLLYKCGYLAEDLIQRCKKESTDCGKASSRYAWVLDQRTAERKRGHTIRAKYRQLRTPNFQFSLVDTPGKYNFMQRMMSDTSQARTPTAWPMLGRNTHTFVSLNAMWPGSCISQYHAMPPRPQHTHAHMHTLNIVFTNLAPTSTLSGRYSYSCNISKTGRVRS